MLTSPISLTFNGVPADHHRVSTSESASIYQTADGNSKLTVSHQRTKTRLRHMAKIERTVVAADQLTAENAYQTASVHIVVDEPIVGFADADLDYQVDELILWLSAANIAALLASRH